jgi:hypothetical protein
VLPELGGLHATFFYFRVCRILSQQSARESRFTMCAICNIVYGTGIFEISEAIDLRHELHKSLVHSLYNE